MFDAAVSGASRAVALAGEVRDVLASLGLVTGGATGSVVLCDRSAMAHPLFERRDVPVAVVGEQAAAVRLLPGRQLTVSLVLPGEWAEAGVWRRAEKLFVVRVHVWGEGVVVLGMGVYADPWLAQDLRDRGRVVRRSGRARGAVAGRARGVVGEGLRVTASLVLARLRGVDWDMRWDLAFDRNQSRRVLMWEYLRRAAVWAKACGGEEAWPFYDVTAYLDPGFELPPAQAAELEELQRTVFWEELRKTCAGAVRLAGLRERTPDAVAGLPDPYEPLVLFYERGGSFSRDCSGVFIDLVGVMMRPGKLDGYLGSRPVGVLDDAVLDALEGEGRITYFGGEAGVGPLFRRRQSGDVRADEVFGPGLCWEPAEAAAAGLPEVGPLEAARRLGRIVSAATAG
ncbi:hypothetical protein AB0D45_29810 [Streptomyces sp. NPDC048352]|uniref:hypothetical protein n=1 Tax=Streptomyces sp. NPDC048352 TaxID=3154718 RepID=UPI003441A14D